MNTARPTRLAPGLLAAALCAVAAPAPAATVQVQVTDAAGRPLAGAVVFVESREARAAVKPLQGAEVAQVDKQFSPQVSVVTVGTAVDFPNRDKVRHQVYSFSQTKNFELKLYAGTPSNPVLFDKPGIAVLGCNIHDNMAAWVVIVDTPHHGRTAATGRVAIDDVPAGNYRLRVWHADLPVGAPALDQPLNVAVGGAAATVRLVAESPK